MGEKTVASFIFWRYQNGIFLSIHPRICFKIMKKLWQKNEIKFDGLSKQSGLRSIENLPLQPPLNNHFVNKIDDRRTVKRCN